MSTAVRQHFRVLQPDEQKQSENARAAYLSVVIPVYRAEAIVPELVRRLTESLAHVTADYEVILVNDGSPDGSWQQIEAACENEPRLVGIKLSRNFGQHCAITAGLEHARGQWIVVMDCDLQDRPEEIARLVGRAEDGYDLVFARRSRRTDTFCKKLTSKFFYSVLGYLTDTHQDPAIGNFGVYHRKVIDAILSMDDSIKYFPTMVKWVGFESTGIDVKHDPRLEGKTSYSLRRLIDLALNVVLSFSDKPLRLTARFGLFISFSSFCCAVYFLVQYFAGRILVLGFASLIISIWFLSGIIITLMGMLGLYVGRIFDQTKNRPAYLVDRIVKAD